MWKLDVATLINIVTFERAQHEQLFHNKTGITSMHIYVKHTSHQSSIVLDL